MNDISGGTQFDFTYAPGTSAEQILAFEMAGEVWSSYLNDDVSVSIYVESTSELPDEVIGAALPGKKRKEKYKDVKRALAGDITSTDDQLAFENLPTDEKEFSILVDGQELEKTKEFRITNANSKSLGLSKNEGDKLDGYILINDLTGDSEVAWSYDALRSNSIGDNEIDLVSVAMHEIGHVLGFVSGIDDGEWLEVLAESREEEKEIEDKDFKFASPLDLYRYSDSSPEPGKIDLSVGGNPFFSIDGGNNNLGNFANGEYTQFGGDGYQASHWQQYSSQGIMNPVLPEGQTRNISSQDLTALDVIGWDINTAAAQSWSQMYDNATANAETANIQNREKDVEDLIEESGYDGRRSRRSRRSSRRRYSLQLGGYWQFTTIDDVDAPEVIVEETPIATEVENIDSNQPESVIVGNVDNTNTNDSNSDDLAVADNPVVVNEAEAVENEAVNGVDSVQIDPDAIANDDGNTVNNSNQNDSATPAANSQTPDLDPTLDDEEIATNNLDIQTQPQTTDLDPEISTQTVETFDSQLNAIEPIVEQSSGTSDLNPTITTSIENDGEDDLDDPTKSAVVENDSDLYDDNDDDDDKEFEDTDEYTLDYSYLTPQSVTGIENNGQDALLYQTF